MHQITKYNRDKLLDLLTERLTFERAGVKLYDSILKKMRASGDPVAQRMISDVEVFRNQEKQHEEWLEEQIRNLGGDTQAKTEMAKLVEIESEGFEKVILDGDPQIPHLFHTLLQVELADNAGWELLVRLAEEVQDDDARRAFRRFLHEEEDHLSFAQAAVREYAKQALLGTQAQAPGQQAQPRGS